MKAAAIVLLAAALSLSAQSVNPQAAALIEQYVKSSGGESALRAIRTRITEGEFDNGRGLKTRFVTYEQAPNKRVTVIGTSAIDASEGSGRGFDGAIGWDKNFIGTGLRTLEGAELAAFIRESDLLRPLRLLDECASLAVAAKGDDDLIECKVDDKASTRLHFQGRTGLLVRTDLIAARGTSSVLLLDYRQVDGLQLPWLTRTLLPGAAISYTVKSVRHNSTIDGRVFQRPRS